jgi:low affinity Fe/Cu permease
MSGIQVVRNQEVLGDRFNRLAARLTEALGSIKALVLSVVVVLVWAVTGPIFHFSDTWQLVINTATTVVTFWMVFVIQNSANRDAKAVQLKLDEIIRATKGARNELITLERAPEAVVAKAAEELRATGDRATARARSKRGPGSGA